MTQDKTALDEVRAGFTPGHVLRYSSSQSHCREGIAFVTGCGVPVDTYWRPSGDSESHILTAQERETAVLLFDTAEFDALDRDSPTSREKWATYAQRDRGRIPSQHGLQEALFIRKGAEPHLGTQIEHARAALGKAGDEMRAAKRRYERLCGDLSALEALAARESEVPS